MSSSNIKVNPRSPNDFSATVHDCGFVARCALEEGDASQVRIDKIYSIIAECRLLICACRALRKWEKVNFVE